jgi:hypothetical protein
VDGSQIYGKGLEFFEFYEDERRKGLLDKSRPNVSFALFLSIAYSVLRSLFLKESALQA